MSLVTDLGRRIASVRRSDAAPVAEKFLYCSLPRTERDGASNETTESLAVGIACAKNGEMTLSAQKLGQILRKISSGANGPKSKSAD
jgi:hypothetical protein